MRITMPSFLILDQPKMVQTLVSTQVMGTYGYAAPEFVMTGAQKAIQLAAHCLGHDPKARPLMSEVVEALKPLPNLNDVACSSSHFQVMPAECAGSVANARNGGRLQGGFPSSNGQPSRSIPTPNGPHVSPYNLNHLHRSPKPDVGQPSE
ncbi:hypothetical protein SLEP1_g20293 [Rubroshorea leprosula]|uniref:Uncharacterized protein n=1 Tax=Rubroshorea leprosula TaxID=152421 RepID=A0AAV5JE58_9ROSI|nr:hypothetical protein SLEP1_g20293 [Rubroshorea leprosula]